MYVMDVFTSTNLQEGVDFLLKDLVVQAKKANKVVQVLIVHVERLVRSLVVQHLSGDKIRHMKGIKTNSAAWGREIKRSSRFYHDTLANPC